MADDDDATAAIQTKKCCNKQSKTIQFKIFEKTLNYAMVMLPKMWWNAKKKKKREKMELNWKEIQKNCCQHKVMSKYDLTYNLLPFDVWRQ